jgi:DNA replication protein DnaC
MEKLQMPQKLLRSINWVSDHCDQHNHPQQMMIINGETVCPRCKLDQENAKLVAEESRKFQEAEKNKQYNTLKIRSVVADQTLLGARLDNYMTEHPEEIQNKQIVLEALDHYKQGTPFNLVLQGKQGTGKSHLTYGLLHDLNETRSCSCLFVSVDEMLRKIKDSFNNKESRYTESYFVDLLSSVDFLGLDDLGAETGAVNTDKSASDFVQRVLYGVTNARQNKSTIITTNLSSEHLFKMYDKKLVSRLLKNPKVVIFKDSKDKRISQLPF